MEFLTVGFGLISGATTTFTGELPENSFRGMASVFNGLIDSWVPTTIHAGAFSKTLQESGKRVKLLWQHDTNEPIGVPEFLYETAEGLALQGKISMTQRGKDALQLMRDGVLDGLSIGFDPIKDELEYGPNGDVIMRHIREVRLWEVSCVTWGADPSARISEVNSIGTLRQPSVAQFSNLPLCELSAPWDLAEAESRVGVWANASEKANAKYARAYLWCDAKNKERHDAYRLPFGDVIDGKLMAVPTALYAIAANLQLGRLDFPAEDLASIEAHVARYIDTSLLEGYSTEDALALIGQKLVKGLSLDEALSLLNKLGAGPVIPPTQVDVEALLLDAELIFMQVESD